MINFIITQAETVQELLKFETVAPVGLLLAICALLIYDKGRKEKSYTALQDRYIDEQKENKKLLIELVSKSILATEQNTQAIKTLRDVYTQRD